MRKAVWWFLSNDIIHDIFSAFLITAFVLVMFWALFVVPQDDVETVQPQDNVMQDDNGIQPFVTPDPNNPNYYNPGNPLSPLSPKQ